jgi:diguanylate cyclase (GGDEF)-like protein
MSSGPLSIHPLCSGSLSVFFADSRSIVVGRIDASGAVVSANPALRLWFPKTEAARFEDRLAPRSRARWRLAVAGVARTSAAIVGLRIQRRRGQAARYRCLVTPGEDGSVWIVGEPVQRRPMRRFETLTSLRSELEEARRAAEKAERTDVLTGLANRRQAEQWLAEATASAERNGTPLSCLIGDLDEFKAINDTQGHLVGDRVLVAATRTLANGLREGDRLARYGGEEFLILLPERLAGAHAAAERLRRLMAAVRIGRLAHPLTISFGAAERRPGEAGQQLLERADSALLRAKRSGRNRVELDETDPAPPPIAAAGDNPDQAPRAGCDNHIL